MTQNQMKQIAEEALRAVRYHEKAGLTDGCIELGVILRKDKFSWVISLVPFGFSIGEHSIIVTDTDESTQDSIKQDIIRKIEDKLPEWKELWKSTLAPQVT